jgi:hypothetical protein
MAAGSTAAHKARRNCAGSLTWVAWGARPKAGFLLPLPTCQNEGFPRVIPPLTKR